MKNIRTYCFIVLVIMMFISVFSCYMINQEPALVCFDLGSLVKGENRAPALNAVDGIRLNITGPGMDAIEKYYPPQAMAVSVEVPAGKDRAVAVALEINPLNPGAVLAFGDRVVTNLKPGEIKVITMRMKPVKTKLVVPDFIGTSGNEYGRVIQFDDISGSGRQELFGNMIGWPDNYYFKPHDIAFDGMGRIYIANNYASTGFGCVVRVDNIYGENLFPYADTGSGIVAVAVDMERQLLYYASNGYLWRCMLDDITNDQLNTTNIGTIRGIDIDEYGLLYIAGAPALGGSAIYYYDPFNQAVLYYITDATVNQLNSPWDVLVKHNLVYISNAAGGANQMMLQFDRNLNYILGYGTPAAGIDINKGMFYGPHMFVAILNKKITVIDETFSVNKIVSMDDITGKNWQTYPDTAIDGTAFFNFYDC
jgi:hypothetical protein